MTRWTMSFVILAAAAALTACAESNSERLEIAPLPGPVLDSTILVPRGAAKTAMGRWRSVRQPPNNDRKPAAVRPPAAYFQTETFTMVIYCYGVEDGWRLGVAAGGVRGYHHKDSVKVRYRFDGQPPVTTRWRWYADTAAQTGPAAAAFARQLAKRKELRIYIRHEGAKPQTMSLKGSAAALRKVLKTCA
jgi:hypothetical protein